MPLSNGHVLPTSSSGKFLTAKNYQLCHIYNKYIFDNTTSVSVLTCIHFGPLKRSGSEDRS